MMRFVAVLANLIRTTRYKITCVQRRYSSKIKEGWRIFMRKRARTKSLSNTEVARVASVSMSVNSQSKIDYDSAVGNMISRCERKGLANVTITYYRNELKVFRYYLADCNKEGLSDIARITSEDIPKFASYMRTERQATVGNINTKLKALRTFFKVNGKESIANACKALPDDKYKIKAFTTAEVTALLNTCDLTKYYGIRDYTMMLVFADTGIRVKELCGLMESDFYPKEHSLHIRSTKNKYDRYAPISEEVVRMIRLLLELGEGGPIFQSLHGEPLTERAIQNRIKIAGKNAKLRLSTRCSPHTFRHYYAKTMVENGANVFELQKLLGHHSLEMVRVYVNLFDRDVFNAHEKYSPTNNILRKK